MHMDRRIDLIQFHGINEAHAAIADMKHGQPCILVWRARASRVTKEKLVHIRLAVSRIHTRNHGRRGRAEAPDLTHTETVA